MTSMTAAEAMHLVYTRIKGRKCGGIKHNSNFSVEQKCPDKF